MSDKIELATAQKELALAETELGKAKEKIRGYKSRLEKERNARIENRREIEALKKAQVDEKYRMPMKDRSTWVYRASMMAMAVLLGVLLVSIGTWTSAARLLIVGVGAVLTFLSILIVFRLSMEAQNKSIRGLLGAYGTLWLFSILALAVLIVGLNLSSLEVVQKVTEKINPAPFDKTAKKEQKSIDLEEVTSNSSLDVEDTPEDSAKVDALIKDAEKAFEAGRYALAKNYYRKVIEQSEKYKWDVMKMNAIVGLLHTLQKLGNEEEALQTVVIHRKWVEESFKNPTENSVRFLIEDAASQWAANKPGKAVALLGKALHIANKQFPKNLKLRWEILSRLISNQISQGNKEGAVNTFNAHVAHLESQKPVDHVALAVAHGDVGGFFLDNAKYRESLPYFEKATQVYEVSNQMSSLEAGYMHLDYAMALYYLGNKDKAIDTLLQAKTIFEKFLPEGHDVRIASEALYKRFQQK